MDFTIDGINWIIAIQSLGAWLEMPMRFFTFLGSENFFFLMLPLLYWSVDAQIGIRVAALLVASNTVNTVFKLLFASPRPYWISTDVHPLSVETSFGVPSGHAQNAVVMWGVMASRVGKRWAWVAAIMLAFFIGVSRLYLGMHFAADVLAGWLIGGILLFVFLQLWDPVSAWISKRTLIQQIVIAFLVSLVVIGLGVWRVAQLREYVLRPEWITNALRSGAEPAPISLEDFITGAGTLFGLAAGAAWIMSLGGYETTGPVEKRALRYVIGLIGILILWRGLGLVLPRDENTISFLLRYLRYTLVGFWITGGAPWLFFHFKLASPPKI